MKTVVLRLTVFTVLLALAGPALSHGCGQIRAPKDED